MATKETIAESTATTRGIGEIGQGKGIENVTGNEDAIKETIKLEKFMNEELEIELAPSGNPEDNPVAVPSVGGINMPMELGKRIKVKRKYVEVLAHSFKIIIQQNAPVANTVEGINVRAIPALTHNFQVIKDPSGAVGREWLKKLLAQPQI